MTTLFCRKLTALIVVLILLNPLINHAVPSELSQKRKQLTDVKKQLKQTREKIKQAKAQEAQLVAQIESMDTSILALQTEYDRLDRELEKVGAQREETERQLYALQIQLYNTQEELDRTEDKLVEQKGVLGNRVENVYKRGKSGYLDIILNSSDFVSFLNRLRFLEYIVAQDIDIVERIEKVKAAIEEQKLHIEQTKAEVNTKRVQLVDEERKIKDLTEAKLAQKKALEQENQKKETLLGQIKENRAAYELAEDELLESSNSLVSRIKQLEQSLSKRKIGRGSYASSGFAWPTEGPLTSSFGMRMHPILGYNRMHNGIDIGAPYGQNVVAAQDGIIIQAGWIKGYGNTVIVAHGDGISSLYAHLSRILTSEGESVSRGSTIAQIGSTGLSTGPHLHFEIRKNGEPQNPMNWY